MKKIPLTQGLVAIVDDEDYEAVMNAGSWFAYQPKGKRTAYARRNIRRPDGTRGMLPLHTFLTGYPQTDHVNRDGLDNRRANLRTATGSENAHNKSAYRNNTSGYKGVSYNRLERKWKAYISIDYRRQHLGTHATAEDAARAYDRAARDLHGEFAVLNFPELVT